MCADPSQFYIALPGCRRALPYSRLQKDAGKEEEQQADEYAAELSLAEEDVSAYLRGLPRMPEFLRHLSGCYDITAAEQLCIGRQIQRLAKVIREAREQWMNETGVTEETLGVEDWD